jgi:peptidoglycan/xylan/chitin deacetylase (PgdA/CDA1 family)
MIGRNTLKRTVKRTAGWASMLEWLLAAPAARQAACIFYYHRIADVKFVDPRIDDWNVSPLLFERQVAALSEFAEIVPLLDLPHRLKLPAANSKPLVCLTFDDGYAGFHSQALPILQRYRAPATAFVVTGSIGRSEPQQFDKWALKHQATSTPETWRAMTWKELEECAATGLVAIGAHSHRHLKEVAVRLRRWRKKLKSRARCCAAVSANGRRALTLTLTATRGCAMPRRATRKLCAQRVTKWP